MDFAGRELRLALNTDIFFWLLTSIFNIHMRALVLANCEVHEFD